MMAYAVAPDGSELLVRVFMDAGSEINLIKTSTAEKLGLNGERVTLKMAVAGGGETTATRQFGWQIYFNGNGSHNCQNSYHAFSTSVGEHK